MSTNGIQAGHVEAFLRSKEARALERHLAEKRINHGWLAEMDRRNATVDEAAAYFPYQPTTNGAAQVMEERITPQEPFKTEPSGTLRKPGFLINIPCAHLPSDTDNLKLFSLLLKMSNETFGASAKHSEPQARRKLALVLGVNQVHSIDSQVNAAFRTYIETQHAYSFIAHRVVGFFWKPTWESRSRWKKIPEVQEALKAKPILEKSLYALEKAFLVFKCLNPTKAEDLRKKLEGHVSCGLSNALKTQIPFQKIRETIKSSTATLAFAKTFASKSGNSPVYYVTMDADCLKLRTGDTGYFSRFETIIDSTRIKKGFFPDAISQGYQLDEGALPIARFAVQCDMAVRRALNSSIPGSVYFPEPGTGYLISKGDLSKNLKALSFIGRARGDTCAGLESRRLIDNAVSDGLLDKSRFVFEPDGALVTTMPARMKTGTTSAYATLNQADFKKKKVLKALRGVSQVHFSPLDWAHNLYPALPDSVKKGAGAHGKVSGILSHTFAVFDPIGLVTTYEKNHSVTFASAFDKIFSQYETYTRALLAGDRENYTRTIKSRTHLRLDKFPELNEISPFVQGQFALLLDAKKRLKDAHFTNSWTSKVIDAAHSSGHALFTNLKAAVDRQG